MTRPMRILLPPGIGDAHWVFHTLEAFTRGLPGRPHVWSLSFEPKRNRNFDFLKRIPFITARGYHVIEHEELKKVLPNINDEPRNVIEGLLGYDYYICFNRHLRDGGRMEYSIPWCPVNWDYPVSDFPQDVEYRKAFKRQHGRYALFYFSSFGMHHKWAKHFNGESIRTLLTSFRTLYPGVKPVIVGMGVDRHIVEPVKDLAIYMVSETTTGELMSLIRGAVCMVGFHNGPTLIAPHLGCPTIMLWSRTHFKQRAFRWNWLAPKKRKRIYLPVEVEDIAASKMGPASDILDALVSLELRR